MKLSTEFLINAIDKACTTDLLLIKDHRGNRIELRKGKFMVNETQNLKDRDSINFIIVEVTKL